MLENAQRSQCHGCSSRLGRSAFSIGSRAVTIARVARIPIQLKEIKRWVAGEVGGRGMTTYIRFPCRLPVPIAYHVS